MSFCYKSVIRGGILYAGMAVTFYYQSGILSSGITGILSSGIGGKLLSRIFTLRFATENFASGIYIYSLIIDDAIMQHKKMTIIK